jgi:Na+/melibiose symporter-like transporter
MASFPSYSNLKILFGYWGFTTIFLFWSAMIKATRLWGGEKHQGIAYGLLDGGRGLVGALFGVLGVVIFSSLLLEDQDSGNFEERQTIFSYVILISSLLVAFIGILVYLFLKPKYAKDAFFESIPPIQTIRNVKNLLAIPSVWLLMLIIVCAYVAYKITDDFSLYANQVLLFNELDSAKVGSFLLFIRPITGVSIGLLADKSRSSLWMVIGFIIVAIGALFFTSGWITANFYLFFFVSMIIVAIGTYAVRTLYFAAMEEAKIPIAITGTAVGLLSLVGYTPDIFAGPLMGYLLDNSPGIEGHKDVFLMLFSFAFVGLIAAISFYKLNTKNGN